MAQIIKAMISPKILTIKAISGRKKDITRTSKQVLIIVCLLVRKLIKIRVKKAKK